MTVVQLNSTHVEKIAELHIRGIKTGFISSLGLPFVKELYKAIIDCKNSFGFVEQEDDIIRGFVVFTSDLRNLYKTIFLKNFHRLLLPLLAKLISFKTLQNIYETSFYPNKAKKLDLPGNPRRGHIRSRHQCQDRRRSFAGILPSGRPGANQPGRVHRYAGEQTRVCGTISNF